MDRDTQWYGTGKDRIAGMAPKLEERFTSDELIDYLLQKLAMYEDSGLDQKAVMELSHLKEQGRLVVRPCAVGDTVYEIRTKYTAKRKGKSKSYDYSIIGMPNRLKNDPESCYVAPKTCTKSDMIYMGKTVFPTEDEAIEKLMQAKDDLLTSKADVRQLRLEE